MSTEACLKQKIDPHPVAGSLICLHQPETDGNVEIVCWSEGGAGGLMLEGRGAGGANPLEFDSDPHHPGGLGSTCGIMCKSVRWTSSLRVSLNA